MGTLPPDKYQKHGGKSIILSVAHESEKNHRTEIERMIPEAVSSGPNYDLSDVDWDCAGSSFSDPSADPDRRPSPVPHSSIKHSNWKETIRAATKLFQDCEASIGKSRDDILAEVFETEKGTFYLRWV